MFNVGDTVRRIAEVSDSLDPQLKGFMQKGFTYTVVGFKGMDLLLKNCPNEKLSWMARWFELAPPTQKPHVHAEVIKAWADGAKIQFHTTQMGTEWNDCINPQWHTSYKYRVKPEPKPDVVITKFLHTHGSLLLAYSDPQRSSPRNEAKITFDGETGALKTVEIIK